MNREQAANAPVDWTAGEVQTGPPAAIRDVYSVRPGEDNARWLVAEAARRGTTPTKLIMALIVEARATSPADAEEIVAVRRGDLRAAFEGAIDRAARRHAA